MDARAVDEKGKALQKASAANEDASVIVSLLKDLKKGVDPTEDLLRSTKIGVTVSRFRGHKNGEVARTAGELVRDWKNKVEQKRHHAGAQKTASKVGPAGDKATGTGTPKSGTGSPAPAAAGKAKAELTVPPEKRSWKADNVDIHKTGDINRDPCIGLMYDGLVFLSTAPSSNVLSIAISVEQAAAKQHPPNGKEYKDKMRMLFMNLKNKSNSTLRVRVLNGEIPPHRLVNMTHDELKSKERIAEDKEMERLNMRDAQMPQADVAISDSLTCPKCGQKKVSYTQAQTRSADEPMTTFCTCNVCGKRWKFS